MERSNESFCGPPAIGFSIIRRTAAGSEGLTGSFTSSQCNLNAEPGGHEAQPAVTPSFATPQGDTSIHTKKKKLEVTHHHALSGGRTVIMGDMGVGDIINAVARRLCSADHRTAHVRASES
jgi:hypothetical protein